MNKTWENIGKILEPRPKSKWMATHTGAAFALQVRNSIFNIYVTGRDISNRSHIGRVRIDLRNPKRILEMTEEPVLKLGHPGAFDENGVSYPCIVCNQKEVWMYYVGWMPGVLTPFQVDIGLAVQKSKDIFKRYSRAPILERTNEDYLGMGSCFVLKEGSIWKMWYTAFTAWEKEKNKPKHRYVIKYAESRDGIHWDRHDQICIGFQNSNQHSICRPSVLKIDNEYHMWYCYRGLHYRIGYATSGNGVHWQRKDDQFKLKLSGSGWDSRSQVYPHVFIFEDYIYLLYSGNAYGKEGLGLARTPLQTYKK